MGGKLDRFHTTESRSPSHLFSASIWCTNADQFRVALGPKSAHQRFVLIASRDESRAKNRNKSRELFRVPKSIFFSSSFCLFFSLALLSLGNSIKLNASDGEARAQFSTLEIETREEKNNRNNIATTTSNVKK